MNGSALVFTVEDPRTPEVADLVRTHLSFSHEHTPAEHVWALGVEALTDPSITLYGARRGGELVGMGALRELDPSHGEIKSMHVRRAERGAGLGQAVLDHLLGVARARGYRRVSLETGTMEAFGPARRMYEHAGFTVCPPFGEYTDNEHSVCMTVVLRGD
ncbi:MAG TPA: GNAT family N-acetyltransferase [Acidimicrobiales bacterium]